MNKLQKYDDSINKSMTADETPHALILKYFFIELEKLVTQNILVKREFVRSSVRNVDPNVLRSEAKTGIAFSKG